ncbi:hypothetical protein BCR41DRAFT_350762 [Lobosporangium transversale]|uniref:Uncharacterized protein n=1 Tax=Lobosporangium transversale TaxID=64571 RepID=A0A1Y2GS35_9FUNG|nr:hypothetical protein BCR41DRAFT_350762 [Lobosporangium transversale]ORZ20969.1 hypothetical protein BCR41DRAFT_350762 [Lobosporangium transversale]|eukprot:XP_021882878.1 hypothetical protein BCR41DRAFT_350762 [Lobosporangium transversale]
MPDLDTTSVLSDDLTVSDLGFKLLGATAPEATPPNPVDLATIGSDHGSLLLTPTVLQKIMIINL